MTTSFHAPRTAGRSAPPSAVIDVAETELAELYELPGGEVSPEELALEIVGQQADEFTCGSCFLVRHRSQLVREKNGLKFCHDCEG
ncbi:DUF4193 family protein [Arthrobacter sp. TMN-49]